jgi:cell wall-associated NlpC family hydrolase
MRKLNWTNKYIEIPFLEGGHDPKTGLDCYRLAVLVYSQELGIKIQDFKGVFVSHNSPESIRRVHRTIQKAKKDWDPVTKPEAFDLIILRTGKLEFHVGIVVDRTRMLHIEEGGYSGIEQFTGQLYKDRVMGFYRYARR